MLATDTYSIVMLHIPEWNSGHNLFEPPPSQIFNELQKLFTVNMAKKLQSQLQIR